MGVTCNYLSREDTMQTDFPDGSQRWGIVPSAVNVHGRKPGALVIASFRWRRLNEMEVAVQNRVDWCAVPRYTWGDCLQGSRNSVAAFFAFSPFVTGQRTFSSEENPITCGASARSVGGGAVLRRLNIELRACAFEPCRSPRSRSMEDCSRNSGLIAFESSSKNDSAR